MTEEQQGDPSPPRPFDELKSKRIGRRVQLAIDFREEVFARDPDSVVEPHEAAAILGLQVGDLETTWMKVGWVPPEPTLPNHPCLGPARPD